MSFLRKAGLFAGAMILNGIEAANDVSVASADTGLSTGSSTGSDASDVTDYFWLKIAGIAAGSLCFLACCYRLCLRPCCCPTKEEKRQSLLGNPVADNCAMGVTICCVGGFNK